MKAAQLLSIVNKLKNMKAAHYFALGVFTLILTELALLLAPAGISNARTFLDANPGYNGAQMWYNCGGTSGGGADFKLVVSENPSCTSGSVSTLNNYSSGAWMHFDSTGGKQWRVDAKWSSYYCNPFTSGCANNEATSGIHTYYFNSTSDSVTTRSDGQTRMCGGVQNDFGFKAYFKNSSGGWTFACGKGDFSHLNLDNATWTYCRATNSCTPPTPTPTHIPTPTPTHAPSATPTPTGRPTATPTPTGRPTATPTPTGVPTATPTATPTVTETPTPTATGTLTPTATPTVTDTPTPTATGTVTPTNTPTDTPTGTVTPVLGVSIAPQQPLTQTPKTGPEALVWILELVGALPLGMFLRKSAKLK